MVNIGVKKLDPEAQLPKMQREGDAAFDVYAVENTILLPRLPKIVNCGIALEIPSGFKVLIYGRSGLATKGIFAHIGTVDPNYKGMVGPILINLTDLPYEIKKGDRVGQIVSVPIMPTEFTEVVELSESVRGSQGFGSSGR